MEPWILKNRRYVFSNRRMQLFCDEVKTDFGQLEYTHLKLKDGVMIVPITVDPSSSKITFFMVEEYRYPIGSKMYEFPGGAIDPGETAEQAAKRELKEETGCSGDFKFIQVIHPIPGESSSKTFVYLAKVTSEGEPKVELTEKAQGLRTVKLTDDELLDMIHANEISDSRTLSSLFSVLFQNKKSINVIRKELG